MPFEAGNPTPVTMSTQPALAEAAQPVYVVDSAPPIAGRARRVMIVRSGRIKGGAPIPVYNVGDGALYTDDPPIPVYVVSGILDPLAYTKQVQALPSLIAYWPLADTSGTTVTDASGNGRTGTYANVTLGQTGIGDGRTAASFNGTTSAANVYSASLNTAFSPTEGTIAAWVRVSAAGVWTDATVRQICRISADSNNRVTLTRSATDNQIQLIFAGGGVFKTMNASTSTTNWFHLALTWSTVANQVIGYINGAAIGAPATMATWSGVLLNTGCTIGASSTVPAQVWSGTLAHVLICNTALAGATITQLTGVI